MDFGSPLLNPCIWNRSLFKIQIFGIKPSRSESCKRQLSKYTNYLAMVALGMTSFGAAAVCRSYFSGSLLFISAFALSEGLSVAFALAIFGLYRRKINKA